jgi:hypothetical protein
MTVEAIKDAIAHLSEVDRQQLAKWFGELEEDDWDRQIERDFSTNGPGTQLLQRLNIEIDAGNFTALADGLHERQEK